MKEEIQYFNSHDAAKILGVNVSTIKRWTDEGKLECIKSLGGHRKFLLKHFADFLEQNNKKVSKVNLFPLEDDIDLQISHYILKGNFDYLSNYILEQAFACDRQRVQRVLNGLYLGQYPLHVIFDEVLTPVLHQIGEMWEKGEKSITEEHFASQTIRDSIIRLQGIIRIPSNKISNVFCLNFSTELHDIALKMVDHILELKGYNILYSGQITPMINIKQLFDKYMPQRVYVSSTYINGKANKQNEFDELCQICKQFGSSLYIGGQGFEILKIDYELIKARLYSFKELFEND